VFGNCERSTSVWRFSDCKNVSWWWEITRRGPVEGVLCGTSLSVDARRAYGEQLIAFNCSVLTFWKGNKLPSWIEHPVRYNTKHYKLTCTRKYFFLHILRKEEVGLLCNWIINVSCVLMGIILICSPDNDRMRFKPAVQYSWCKTVLILVGRIFYWRNTMNRCSSPNQEHTSIVSFRITRRYWGCRDNATEWTSGNWFQSLFPGIAETSKCGYKITRVLWRWSHSLKREHHIISKVEEWTIVPSRLKYFSSSFPVPVCAITASGVPGGTLVSMNRFSTLCVWLAQRQGWRVSNRDRLKQGWGTRGLKAF
jgi:hypothetical protein